MLIVNWQQIHTDSDVHIYMTEKKEEEVGEGGGGNGRYWFVFYDELCELAGERQERYFENKRTIPIYSVSGRIK